MTLSRVHPVPNSFSDSKKDGKTAGSSFTTSLTNLGYQLRDRRSLLLSYCTVMPRPDSQSFQWQCEAGCRNLKCHVCSACSVWCRSMPKPMISVALPSRFSSRANSGTFKNPLCTKYRLPAAYGNLQPIWEP